MWYSNAPDPVLNATVISLGSGDAYANVTHRVLAVWRHVWRHYPQHDWYVRLWPDNYAFPDRFSALAAQPVRTGRAASPDEELTVYMMALHELGRASGAQRGALLQRLLERALRAAEARAAVPPEPPDEDEALRRRERQRHDEQRSQLGEALMRASLDRDALLDAQRAERERDRAGRARKSEYSRSIIIRTWSPEHTPFAAVYSLVRDGLPGSSPRYATRRGAHTKAFRKGGRSMGP